MQKYIITITPVKKNQPLPTIVLDVSADAFSVNYPKDVGIKVDSRNIQSHSELCVKMPHDDKEFHLWYADHQRKTRKEPMRVALSNRLRELHPAKVSEEKSGADI